jgi:xylitol oxidase
MSHNYTNWAGNIVFRAERVERPVSLDEVRSVVTRNAKVRALGSGHSFNDIADSSGTLISLAGLPPEVEIDSARATAKVAASVRYAELGQLI